jgi:hypothetical protein
VHCGFPLDGILFRGARQRGISLWGPGLVIDVPGMLESFSASQSFSHIV